LDQSNGGSFGKDKEGEALVETDITVQFSITIDSEDGQELYNETHGTKTDRFGIFRLIVGRGQRNSTMRLEDLDLAESPRFLHIYLDAGKGKGLEYLGAEEL